MLSFDEKQLEVGEKWFKSLTPSNIFFVGGGMDLTSFILVFHIISSDVKRSAETHKFSSKKMFFSPKKTIFDN